MRIDLHLHTTASDGSLTPTEVVAAAVAGRLDVIAITDHDTAAGVAEARSAADGHPLHVIPGIEISTSFNGAELHMLGYLVDDRYAPLVEYGNTAASYRRDRMRGMIERLAGLGISVAYDDVVTLAGAGGTDPESLGRPHLARAIVQGGYAHSLSEAFDRFIGNDGPAFLPAQVLDVAGAIALIHDAGGIAVWAHPRPDLFARDLAALRDLGVDGVECHRPRVPPPDAARMGDIAREHGLLVTGGSDWHGEWHGALGEFVVERSLVGGFLERAGI